MLQIYIYNINTSKTVLLFGAATGGVNNPYKGWEYMVKAIQKLETDKYELAILGECNKKEIESLFLHKKYFIGNLSDEYSLSTLYNAVDMLVIPTLADNYPNMILESLSCGTPVVSTNIGGVPDLIEHKVNGYLATPKDTDSLVEGIEWTNRKIQTENNINHAIYMHSLKKFNTDSILQLHQQVINRLTK